MAPSAPSPTGGGGERYSTRPYTFQQWDIDKGTELFRKQLEGSNGKKQGSQPSIKGGLPPHLLRQKINMDPPADAYDRTQVTTTPSNASTCLLNARQQKFQPFPTPEARHAYLPHDSQAVVLRRIPPRPPPPGPSHTHIQQRRPVDTRNQDIADVGLPASRWAGGPQQVQRQHSNEQSQAHEGQQALVPTGGVQLSVATYDGWSPFDRNDGEQCQQFNTNEPEQTERRKWRPKHSCDMQSQDLPDSVASSLSFNDSDNSLCEEAALRFEDIRNTVGGDLDLVPRAHGEGFFNKHQWDEYPDETRSLAWRPTYCQLWVKEMEKEQWPVAVFLNMKDMAHAECDVKPSNGWLMAPIDYPDTHIDPNDAKCVQNKAASVRRIQATSALKIKSDYSKLKRRVDEREGELKWEPTQDPFPVVPPAEQPAEHCAEPTPPSTQSYVNRSPVMAAELPIHRPERIVQHPIYGAITHLPHTFESKPPPTYLKIACFLRPAEEQDIPQILNIYNWEVSHGMQALDTRRLCLKDMERVFQQCKDAETPIIVAIAGTVAEAKARKESTITPYGRHTDSQQRLQQPAKDKVIGFAYVSILAPGLAGDINYNVGRFTGQVHIYVAYECRRKGIGRALLQRITIFCSRHAGYYAGEYKWYDPERMPTYDEAAYNSRNYSRIFIQFASRARNDPDTLWMSSFLDTENFICVSTQDKARKVGYGEAGKLVDCLVWQHDCQDLDNMRENIRFLR
ncbi:hypothetical protein N0V93_004781 [Gnomoniopsis smithogilvyi]|uniref:N-acetyltransferase domain-containing protein n=1 Tax=Gnomoniopsis smithogilvyi TaxID=1191159 RepID=A0A9W8YUB5_9PEZI|nr:hypothetical protein N0V93_004781 [Gnomoniopsis smithogilvyi]